MNTHKQTLAVLVSSLALAFSLPLNAVETVTRGPAPSEPQTFSAIEGTISAIETPGPVIFLMNGLLRIDATEAKVQSASRDGHEVSLAIGQRVTAMLKEPVPASGLPVAQTIFVTQDLNEAVLQGALTAVDLPGSSFSLLGTKVFVDSKTVFGGLEAMDGDFGLDDLKVSDPIFALATHQGNSLIALRVMRLMRIPVPMETLRGKVTAIGTNSWTIAVSENKRETVQVNAQTKIVGEPKAGDDVEVLGRRDAAGVLVAQLIAKIPSIPPAPAEMLNGKVLSIAADAWKVSLRSGQEVTVKITSETKITGSPSIGDTVEILGTRNSAGDFVAQIIVKIPSVTAEDVKFEGTVKEMKGAYWTVDTTRVMVTRSTSVTGAPKVGDRVAVEGKKMPEGTVVATKIEKK